jgi:hypothetical protein
MIMVSGASTQRVLTHSGEFHTAVRANIELGAEMAKAIIENVQFQKGQTWAPDWDLIGLIAVEIVIPACGIALGSSRALSLRGSRHLS